MTTNEILNYIRTADVGEVNLMEVCGTHTHAIARAGIKSLLPQNIKLLSGPGCPVCVTPQEVIDEYLELAMRGDIIIATYGDMIRVPGSRPGDNLAMRRAMGADVRVVYSPIDAIDIAREEQQKALASQANAPASATLQSKKVVFLGVGFETTAPGTAMAIKVAREQGVKNFFVFSMLKRVEPALRALMADPNFNVQGFLVPGHVAVILGEDGFKFLADEYNIPSVIAGFEAEDIWLAIYKLIKQIECIRNNNHSTGNNQVNSAGNNQANSADNNQANSAGNNQANSAGNNQVNSAGNNIKTNKGYITRAKLENAYTRLVHPEGNKIAQEIIASQLKIRDDIFRGMGLIKEGGFGLADELSEFDAEKIFGITYKPSTKQSACRCGEVIKGRLDPKDCPLFGKRCVPEDPVGPCMVSGEGACSAAYKYL